MKLKPIRNGFYLSLLYLCIASCEPSEMVDKDLFNIEFTEIGQGNLYGNKQERISKSNLVIRKQEDWESLLEKMNSVNQVSDEFTETDIDFEQYQIIAVFDTIYGTGGNSIDITNISSFGGYDYVKVENLLTGNLATVITQPFHIIKMPKDKRYVFFQ